MAACAVVLHHANLAAHDFLSPPVFSPILNNGYLGVDFFFVLSGFIIFYATECKIAPPLTLRSFLLQRAIRIYVPYFPLAIFLGVAYTLLPQISGANREFGWLTTITLLPSEQPPALSVAWTLRHEIVFYAIFGIAYFSGWLLRGMAIWCCAILAANALNLVGTSATLSPIFNLINIEFLLGMGIAWFVLNERRVPPIIPVFGMVAAWSAWGVFFANRSASPLIAAGLACAILLAVQAEKQGSLRVSYWLSFLGDASYVVYLTHGLIISVLIRIIARSDTAIDDNLSIVIMTIVSVILGGAAHIVFERPALSFIRRLLRRRKEPTTSIQVPAFKDNA